VSSAAPGANILPQAVSPADAATILAVVNGAETAQALAAAIELPNEPDVGLRLATHLLARRAAAGPFTSLDQLLDVQGIGPVRFTRIVRAILGDTEALIAPSAVSEADTATVLSFLNSAETAQDFASGIELLNEPDVGLRLGAHLLERRGELGTFTSLDQLLTVKLIGPVRFTRIIRAILGKGATVPRDEFDALAAQVAALQEALALGPPRVALTQVGPQRYLGQPLTVLVTATEATGAPLAGAPVTLSASWGRLGGSDGFSVQQSASVTLRTAADGTVRVTLVAPTSEDLQADQQAAVELVLDALDPAAPTPADASEALTSIVESYRFEANDDFRDGVDIYFRDFHQHLLDSVNYRDELSSWPTFDSTVVAYVHKLAEDGTTDTAVVASGALLVHFRDWLGSWLQTHIDLADPDDVLAGNLQLATNTADPNDMLTLIHQRVGEFVSVQQGIVGQVVGQKVAEAKLGGLLETGIGQVPEASQQALFPAVNTASQTVGTLGAQALGALEQQRQDLRTHVDQQIATVPELVEQSAALQSLQDVVNTKLDAADLQHALTQATDFTSFVASFRTYVPPIHIIFPPIVRPGP
jgi:DNA uptake protein ComE-like DNA-binding protein